MEPHHLQSYQDGFVNGLQDGYDLGYEDGYELGCLDAEGRTSDDERTEDTPLSYREAFAEYADPDQDDG